MRYTTNMTRWQRKYSLILEMSVTECTKRSNLILSYASQFWEMAPCSSVFYLSGSIRISQDFISDSQPWDAIMIILRFCFRCTSSWGMLLDTTFKSPCGRKEKGKAVPIICSLFAHMIADSFFSSLHVPVLENAATLHTNTHHWATCSYLGGSGIRVGS